MRDQNSPPPIFMRDQKLQPPIPYEQYVDWGGKHQLYLHKGSKFATRSEQYVDWGNNINFIFIKHQKLPPPMNIYEQYVNWGNNINFIFIST